MDFFKKKIGYFILVLLFMLTSCSVNISIPENDNLSKDAISSEGVLEDTKEAEELDVQSSYEIPEYTDSPVAEVNNNIPFFDEEDITLVAFEKYSELDSLGRCGVAFANICQDLMPTEERESIWSIKPTGWHSVRYDDLMDGENLYNRCHLIAFMLAGENANNLNLITGTRYMNVEGMLPYEDIVYEYVKDTNHHVLYRVTPIFEGNNLLCNGVLMEAKSVEDDVVQFCVFAYNVQPGITLDYATGNSWTDIETTISEDTQEITYIGNINSKKFHLSTCSGLPQKDNRVYFSTRDEAIAQGYSPCGSCHP